MPLVPNTDCGKPSCEKPGTEPYRDGKGNTLRLCEKHYYELVTGEKTLRSLF